MKFILKKYIFIVSLLTTVLFFILLWFFVGGYIDNYIFSDVIIIRRTSFIFYGFLTLAFVIFVSFFSLNIIVNLALKRYRDSIMVMSQLLKNQTKDNIDNISVLPEFEILIRDLSDLIETNIESLKESKHRQKKVAQIMDQMQEGILILNSTFHIILINKKAKEVFNIVRPRRKYTFIQLYRNERITKPLRRLKVEGKAQVDLEVDKRMIRVSLNITENGYTIFTKDVTEILRIEELQRDFSANVSHSLKTPVTSIMGFAELINKGIITDYEKIVQLSYKIYVNSQHLVKLIDDTMQLAYLENEYVNNYELVEISEIVQNILDILAHHISEKKLTVNKTGHGKAKIKYAHMVEIVSNLIENSIKYNKIGGCIDIEIKSDDKLTLIVSDTGIGIDEKNVSRVFDRYYRVPSTVHGNGLGLSIVDTIVKLYGGSISVDSTLNVGTTFTIQM